MTQHRHIFFDNLIYGFWGVCKIEWCSLIGRLIQNIVPSSLANLKNFEQIQEAISSWNNDVFHDFLRFFSVVYGIHIFQFPHWDHHQSLSNAGFAQQQMSEETRFRNGRECVQPKSWLAPGQNLGLTQNSYTGQYLWCCPARGSPN